jgi:F420-dependent oxidoreductase-like protein
VAVSKGIILPYADHLPREMTLAYVQAADRLGYDAVWIAEAYGWDGVTIMTQVAIATERIKIASGILNVFSRSPALLAQTAASLDQISGGRFVLGLGTSGHQVIEGWHSVKFENGIRRMSETIDIVRTVLRRERLDYEGEVFQPRQGLKLITHPVRDRIPIYLATLTPGGIRLAAEKADGWLPVWFSPKHFHTVIKPELEAGAAEAGRSLSELSICPFIQVVVTADRKAGRDAIRPHLALYIGGMGSKDKNYYNQLWRRYGFQEEAARIQDLYLQRRKDEAMALLSDEMVDLTCIVGPADECRERLDDLAKVGVTEVAVGLQVPGNDPAETLRALEALAPEPVRA